MLLDSDRCAHSIRRAGLPRIIGQPRTARNRLEVSKACYNKGIFMKWLSLSNAADYINVSTDTVGRRAIRWQSEAQAGRIRYKLLKLGEDTRLQRRYFVEDLEALLVVGHQS